MARSQSNQATQNFQSAQNLSNTAQNLSSQNQSLEKMYGNQANTELQGVLPTLESEVTNPQGYAPSDLAAMNTAAQQSAGGSMAGAVGQGNLQAARTRNAGAFAPAMDRAAQGAQQTLSQDALGVQAKNANLKEQQRQEGLKGMLGVYDTANADSLAGMGGANNALGTAASALNAGNGAVNSGVNAANSTANETFGWLAPLGI